MPKVRRSLEEQLKLEHEPVTNTTPKQEEEVVLEEVEEWCYYHGRSGRDHHVRFRKSIVSIILCVALLLLWLKMILLNHGYLKYLFVFLGRFALLNHNKKLRQRG